MSWIFFAVAAPALFAATNFVDKFLVEKKVKDPLFITILSGLASLALGIVILFVRGFSLIETKQLVLLLVSGVLLELYLIPYFKALAIDDASRVIPFFQFVPIFVLILSFIVLGEVFAAKQVLGAILIVLGSFILATERLEKGIFTFRKSFWFMMLASLLYAITGILFKLVVITHDFWLTLGYENVGIGIGAIILLLWPSYRRGLYREVKKLNVRVWGLLFINQCLYILALFALFYAFSLVSVAFVSIMSALQPFFVLLYGLILSVWFPQLIREDTTKHTLLIKALAIALIFIGGYIVYV